MPIPSARSPNRLSLAVAGVVGLTVACVRALPEELDRGDAGGDGGASDATARDTVDAHVPAPCDLPVPNPNRCDARTPDAHAPAADALASPALSCKAILAADGAAASGMYMISATGKPADAFWTYCDMRVDWGGWTKVTAAVPASQVTLLRGPAGRQMLKCNDTGDEHIISPPFSSDWTWNGATFTRVAGMWIVNGFYRPCGDDAEYTDAACTTWWGVGCGGGPGITNKLFPGVLDAPTAASCADTTSAHTNQAFSICESPGLPANYRAYSVFVRAD